MTYRTDEIEFTEPWDVLAWGSGAKVMVGKRMSSPIVGPRETLAKIRMGVVVESPVKLQVESGKTYVLLGEHKGGWCRGHGSLVASEKPVIPPTAWQRFTEWIRWEVLP